MRKSHKLGPLTEEEERGRKKKGVYDVESCSGHGTNAAPGSETEMGEPPHPYSDRDARKLESQAPFFIQIF